MFRTFGRNAQWLGIALVAGFFLTGCPCIPGTDFVYFPDSALESAVRASIHKPFGCLSRQDVLQARIVDGSGLSIHSLDGLENCTNITELDLSSNDIKSVTALTGLQNLVALDLHNNKIARIDALAGLFLLRNVDISGPDNDVRDFSPLAANALNGGLGDGAVVTVSNEWVLDSEGNYYADVADDFQIMANQGVNIIVAVPTSGTGK